MSDALIRPVRDAVDYERMLSIRRRVFVEEQGIPESLEIDEHEGGAHHFLATISEEPVGAGRLRLHKSYVKFERIATLGDFRGLGVGGVLMAFMEDFARLRFPHHLPLLHAQQSAVGFYRGLGWKEAGDPFHEAGIPHIMMMRPPTDSLQIQHLLALRDPDCDPVIKSSLEELL